MNQYIYYLDDNDMVMTFDQKVYMLAFIYKTCTDDIIYFLCEGKMHVRAAFIVSNLKGKRTDFKAIILEGDAIYFKEKV